MNDRHVANASRALARARLNRHRFCRLLVAAFGAALGLSRTTDKAVACRKKSARCDRKDQCCSKRCKRGFCYPKKK